MLQNARSRSILAAALLAALAGSFSMSAPALAANHPERQWLVKDSAHFSIHYYPGIENTAMRILHDAEEAYPKLAADFGVHGNFGRIPIILTQDSFFNGEAEPVKDRITLDPVLANSSIVGTQRFVAHELAHVMTFQAVNKGNKLAQLSNLGGLPTWFLEGIAQYAAEYWYPSNDRMLRLHTLENTLLTDSERANFRVLGGDSGAAGYNEGYSLCRYIFDTHGRDKIAVLMENLKDGKRTFEQAMEATFGTNLAAIEAGWKQSLRDGYAKQVKGLQAEVPTSVKLIDTYQGEVNVQPHLSPDGKHLAYLTSRYQDSFLYLRGNVMGFLSLYVGDADGRNAQMLPVGKGAVNAIGWSPDSKKLVYSRLVGDHNGNPSFDLYTYDLTTRQSTRLTDGESANTMAWRPDSHEVAYVSVGDGQNSVKIVDTSTKKVRVIYKQDGDQQFRQPAWSPDGERLVLVTFKPGQMGNLVVLDPDSGKLSELTRHSSRVEDSAPTWTPDGRSVVFTSDRGGMTNLYRVDVASKAVLKLTNTYRGAEMPSVSPDGKLVYFTSYKSLGSMIYRMPLVKGMPVDASSVPAKPAHPPLNHEPLTAVSETSHVANALQAAPSLVGAPGKSFLDETSTGVQKVEKSFAMEDARPYQPKLTNDFLVPQMTSDEKGQQVGLAGTYSDILDKHQLGFDVRYGLMSQRFSYLMQYVNRMSSSTWMVSLYDQPQVALAPDLGTSGHSIYDGLYFQRQRGVGLDIQTPLGGGRALTGGFNFGSLSTLQNPLEGNYGQLREGQHNRISLGYQEQNVSHTIDADINPSDGYRLGLNWIMSDHNFGSSFNYSEYLISGERYFSINPDLRHNLTWRFNLGLINGDAVMPFLLGGATASNPVYQLRGYSVGAFSGNRLATTGLEYTAPIFQHIDRNFGPLYLDRLYVAGFTDVGAAWSQGESANPFASAGVELRLRTMVMGRQMLTLRFGLAKKLGNSDLPGFYLTF